MKKEDALGVRIIYADLLKTGRLQTVFRPFHLKYSKLYGLEKEIDIRLIERPGSHKLGISAQYSAEQYRAKVTDFKVIPFQQLSPADFIGSSPDVQDPIGLTYHLGLIYNLPMSEFNANFQVVRINFQII